MVADVTRAKQPAAAAGDKIRTSQWWPTSLRARIVRQAAREKRSVASMTAILAERGLAKSEPQA